jgi:hypothetical protein
MLWNWTIGVSLPASREAPLPCCLALVERSQWLFDIATPASFELAYEEEWTAIEERIEFSQDEHKLKNRDERRPKRGRAR